MKKLIFLFLVLYTASQSYSQSGLPCFCKQHELQMLIREKSKLEDKARRNGDTELANSLNKEKIKLGEDFNKLKCDPKILGKCNKKINLPTISSLEVYNALLNDYRSKYEQIKNDIADNNYLLEILLIDEEYQARIVPLCKWRYMVHRKICIQDALNKLNNMDKSKLSKEDNPPEVIVWGTGDYDWDGEEFINMIKESGEDLKNEFIYCKEFTKAFQLAISLANKEYSRINQKLENSGAPQSHINAQLSYNRENADWFENETKLLAKYYYQFCTPPESPLPEDEIVISKDIIPEIKEQNADSDEPLEWETEYPEDQNNDPENITGNDTPEMNDSKSSKYKISGNGWIIKQIQSTPNVIKNELTAETNAGRTPAGIFISDNSESQICYINDNPLGITAWRLEWYNDGASLQNGITDYINNGYFPMGISFTGEGNFYVLYIQCQVKGNAWQLVESELDLNKVSQDIQPLISQNYIPVGITVYEGMYYTLMVQVSDAQMSNWTIEGYEGSDIAQNVNVKINQGMIPFGYLKEGDIVNVLYVGF